MFTFDGYEVYYIVLYSTLYYNVLEALLSRWCRGPPGDLYVFVNVKEHPSIRREGLDLYSTITLDYTDAILGSSAKVGWALVM